jgi:transposase-like protein
VDGLKGFPDAIRSVFPNTAVQLCIVHQIRNSIKYVGSKHQKEFLWDLKLVYGAVSKEAAEAELDKLEAKWGEPYPIVIKSWQDNWERLSEFFQVHQGKPPSHLYHQYCRGLSPSDTQGHDEQGRVPL